MAEKPTLVWFRDDLRVADHPALDAAVSRGRPVVALYVLDETGDGIRAPGAAARWWLHHSLVAHRDALAALGIPLVLRRGEARRVVPEVVAETGAGAVTWNRRYSPARRIDADLKRTLRESGLEVHSFPGDVLAEPQDVRTGSGTPYKVFTPFWNGLRGHEVRPAIGIPDAVAARANTPDSDDLDDWGLLPTHPDWAGGLRRVWTPGEEAARARLDEFAAEVLDDYGDRDLPAVDATSRLSPRLRWGEVSPVQVWHRIRGARSDHADGFLRELGWREFFRHTLFHQPELAARNLRPAFDAFPWEAPDEAELDAWRRGRTGIPLVDAGMRELWDTGVMHNRVRMSAASFLVKNLLIDWRVGEQWFWDTLVDADEASNPGNWQWVAGSGQDAAPYFRIFNPERQAARFDPDGAYLARWIPELGTDAYPDPIVDLGETRARALAAYETISRR
ncbi:deoxyribodipyrimidine photo-lyase [Homoserinibacter sp. GY 40078]|uniref:cryptochrome/photolyase family protein n=1 Tax=Homoserinibacter sp. GY 40078 TaxID=2603275 RepID=UPI0011CC8736|nr:deoxyribodipyrimidine photo-lyase [Homoserinibacter sp. GY 40078]TXK18614.1 deoxyribodipyrimidine photo-lyase [Homoserinibacter sp. GY 40078]